VWLGAISLLSKSFICIDLFFLHLAKWFCLANPCNIVMLAFLVYLVNILFKLEVIYVAMSFKFEAILGCSHI
jgi:hypothetical protein